MVGVGLLAGIGFAGYEYLKKRFECETFYQRLAAGCVAGICAPFITHPLSVMKRYRQT